MEPLALIVVRCVVCCKDGKELPVVKPPEPTAKKKDAGKKEVVKDISSSYFCLVVLGQPGRLIGRFYSMLDQTGLNGLGVAASSILVVFS